MSDRQPQSALREWRTQISNPVTLVVLAAVAVLLTILGPFETNERLNLPQLFAYWLVMSAGTYSAGLLISAWLQPRIPPDWHKIKRILALGLATGIAITPVITVLNYISFEYWPALQEWPFMLAQFFTIALVVSIIFEAIAGQTTRAPTNTTKTPALLARLPLEKRAPLVALSSQDHYTQVRTTKGEELILIRLADAITEAEPTPGLRVHRSHWVAIGQVTKAQRDGDRAVLTLSQGADIPVSRANVAALKQAGLLAR